MTVAFTRMGDQPRLVLHDCVEPLDAQGCPLVNHTRVHCPDEEQRRAVPKQALAASRWAAVLQ